jgi:hypothetical protein
MTFIIHNCLFVCCVVLVQRNKRDFMLPKSSVHLNISTYLDLSIVVRISPSTSSLTSVIFLHFLFLFFEFLIRLISCRFET